MFAKSLNIIFLFTINLLQVFFRNVQRLQSIQLFSQTIRIKFNIERRINDLILFNNNLQNWIEIIQIKINEFRQTLMFKI